MGTQRQKRAAKLLIENATLDKPLNAGQIVEKSRYSKSMVIKPNVVLESEGVKEELEALGFSEEGAKQVVSKILYEGKEENRLKAADMVFKVHSTYAPDKAINVNIDNRKAQNKKELETVVKKVISEMRENG